MRSVSVGCVAGYRLAGLVFDRHLEGDDLSVDIDVESVPVPVPVSVPSARQR